MSSSLRLDPGISTECAADLLAVARRLAGVAEDSDAAASILAEGVVSLVNAGGCIVSTLDDDFFHVSGAVGSLAHLRGATHPLGDSLAVRTLHAGRVLTVNKVSDRTTADLDFLRALGVQQVVSAPLVAGGSAFGVVLAVNSGRGAFTDDDAALLQLVAELGSPAVHNARLLERERRGAREARALAEIVKHLNQSLEVERIFTLVAEHAAQLLGGAGAIVTMVEGDTLRVAGAAGHAMGRFGTSLPLDDVFIGEALRGRAPVRTDDLGQFPRWEEAMELLRDVSANAVVAPLLVGDRAIGAVLVYGNATRAFNANEEKLLQSLAAHSAVAVENARLYRAAARTTRHAEILAATGRTLASVMTSETVFDGIERVATELLGARGFTVYSIDPRRRTSQVQHSRGLGTDQVSAIAPSLWEGRPGWAVENATNVILPDLRRLGEDDLSEPLRGLREAGVQSIAFLPLVVDGTVRGLLVMRWLTPRSEDDAEHQLLYDFATHVAIALRNAELVDALERRAARLAAVAQVQQAISRIELGDVYGEVHRAVLSSIPRTAIFALLLVNADATQFLPQLIVVDGVGTKASALSAVDITDCSASRAFLSGELCVSESPAFAWSEHVAGRAGRPPVQAEIAVPILHGAERLGVLVVQGDGAQCFDEEDAAVLTVIARQAGAAIDNARLFEAERQARTVAEAAATIASAALSSRSVTDTARDIIAAVDAVVPSAGKALGLVGDGGETITYVAATGALTALEGRSFPGAASAAALVGTRTAVLTPTQAMLDTIDERGIIPRGAMVVPLLAKDQLAGVLWSLPVARSRTRRRDAESLARLAAHVALAADVLLLGEEEQKRRERERMLATALATMDQPVFILGLDRRIWYANAAAVREYGYSADQLGTLSFDALVASAVPARRVGNAPSMTATSSVWMAEHIHRRRDATQFPASVMLSYIRDDAGAPVGQVMNVRNLTDERRIEEQLRQSEKLAALGELVAGVAHELNNPLAGISAFAQLLLEEPLLDEQRDSVRLIKREADRAVGVIRDLLIFSRKAGPSTAPVDLNEIVELTLRLRSYSLRSADIEVTLDLAGDVPRVNGDAQRLQQVLLNLVVNAEYAMRESRARRLAIRSEQLEQGVLLTISDTGTGMTEETRQRIFEPFFTTKPAGQGTGLGLSVSYGIVRAHGGNIAVESELGSGSAFRLYLPSAGTSSASASTS